MSEHRCIDSSKMLEKLLFNVKHGQVEYELVLKDLKISVETYFYKMAAKKKKKNVEITSRSWKNFTLYRAV